ncbi:MAG: cystathionine gamma-synthase [Candidatus Marinimicrobia bacterium]|jgi:cystathionine beta-lyase/cystathionine gamma-synthase|nr:cystathionine gamma-synthase [Candidatus Neomarinimicrobiota bacterium]|tara:strand:- start:84 stop:1226 length:1143 start_codon:yes stop_codon:yes gene_type:complete
MKFDTKIVRAGIEPDPTTGAIVPPIYQTATYVLPEVGRDLGFDYTRSANPTRGILENNLATIEGGRFGTCFSSGMSAVDSVLKLLKKGDHVVCSDDVYGGVSRHFNNILVNYGLTFTYVDSSNPENVGNAITSETKLFWIETPTNPLLKITDLNAISKIAKKHKILFGVDSTFATPVFLRPFEFGADIVMHSTTKYISGHNQIIGGIIITNDEKIHERMKFVQKTIGAVPSPFDCWLTLLGVKTLHLRMHRHASNAQAVAEFLESHPQVEKITYPGLKSHPQYGVAKEQMDGFSGMISFELKGEIPAGITVMNNVKLCSLAESLGAVETMITHPASMTHMDVPAEERHARGLTDGLVRISVGIEDPEDIIDDLKQALEKV